MNNMELLVPVMHCYPYLNLLHRARRTSYSHWVPRVWE